MFISYDTLATIIFIICFGCLYFYCSYFKTCREIRRTLTIMQQIYMKNGFFANGYILETAEDKDYKYNLLSCGHITYTKKHISKQAQEKAKEDLLHCFVKYLYNLNDHPEYYLYQLHDDFGVLDKSEYEEVSKLFKYHKKPI